MEISIKSKLSNFSKNFILKVMSLLFLVVTILSFSIIYRHNEFYSTYPPRIDFIYQLKSKITNNYWQLGEILEGASNTNIQRVVQNLKNNFNDFKDLRDGSKKVKKLKDKKQLQILEKLIKEYNIMIKDAQKEIFKRDTYRENINFFSKYFLITINHLTELQNMIVVETKTEIKIFDKILIFTVLLEIFSFIVAFFIMFISEKKRAKLIKSLNHLNNELENRVKQRTIELESKVDYIQKTQEILIQNEKMASLGSLVAGVAHEINTPIGNSYTSSTFLFDELQKIKKKFDTNSITQKDFQIFLDDNHQFLSAININLERASKLIKSFKMIAVDQSNKHLAKVEIKQYTKDILLSLKSLTQHKSININLICKEEIETQLYGGDYSQVITNLVQNSITHAFKDRKNGEITIRIEDKSSKFWVSVCDDGIGITNKNLKKIFEPFFTTNRENGGSGLGLNIVENIVIASLDGRITCKSTTKKGTCFTIKIPKKAKL